MQSGDCERVLAAEMVEKRALGHTGADAELIDGGRGVALLTDDGEGRIEKLAARTPRRSLGILRTHVSSIPTGRSVVKITPPCSALSGTIALTSRPEWSTLGGHEHGLESRP